MAQLGSALRSGRRGRGFKSRYPDHSKTALHTEGGLFYSSRLTRVNDPYANDRHGDGGIVLYSTPPPE